MSVTTVQTYKCDNCGKEEIKTDSNEKMNWWRACLDVSSARGWKQALCCSMSCATKFILRKHTKDVTKVDITTVW